MVVQGADNSTDGEEAMSEVYDHSKRKPTTRYNISIYYRVLITGSQEDNVREYFISRSIGDAFLRFSLPSGIEGEKKLVAKYLGLKYGQINFHRARGFSKS